MCPKVAMPWVHLLDRYLKLSSPQGTVQGPEGAAYIRLPSCDQLFCLSLGAQELVRMDSNTQGIENPGYETTPPFQGMPEAKTRPPLSYVAQRQPSESGRHLLSDPSTPLSPPGPGDVFFPSLDPVPDSPNSEAI